MKERERLRPEHDGEKSSRNAPCISSRKRVLPRGLVSLVERRVTWSVLEKIITSWVKASEQRIGRSYLSRDMALLNRLLIGCSLMSQDKNVYLSFGDGFGAL